MKISQNLLKRYAIGKCTKEEKELVEKWLKTEETLNSTKYDALFISQKDGIRAELEERLSEERFHSMSISREDQQSKTADLRRKSFFNQLSRYAAVAIIFITLSFSLYYVSGIFGVFQTIQVSDELKSFVTYRGEKRTVTLSDGSTIRMNYETEIQVPEIFNGDQRVVYMIGHAHFDVARDKKRPFIIYTKDSKTEVLGTSFDVKTKGKDETEIIVTSGKVAFSEKDRPENMVTLTVNDRAVLLAGSKISTNDVDALRRTAWKDNQLVFDGQTMEEVIDVLKPWYDINITVENPKLLTLDFILALDNPSLESTMEELSFLGKFNYHIAESTVIIY